MCMPRADIKVMVSVKVAAWMFEHAMHMNATHHCTVDQASNFSHPSFFI